jgi:NAD(P)-dependent dehydrogenase (short-subunit alcohol dehydrogenase family)
VNLPGTAATHPGAHASPGSGVAKRFLAEGVKVVLGWYASEDWEKAKGLIAADDKGQFFDVRVDATKEEEVENLMRKAKDAFGTIDILLHMVGRFHAGGKIWETDASLFERLVDVNLKTTFLCCKHALKIMLERGRGRIVVFPPKVVSALGRRLAPMPCPKPVLQCSYLLCGKN